MESVPIPGTELNVSRIALGTWAIGGWMWGGTDEKASIATIHAALDKGVTLIDTAPVYGFGRSEEIVGRALKTYGRREDVYLATKAGLEWKNGKISRNSDPAKIAFEVEDSLRRLQTDVIDIYFIHWPDNKMPFEETARLMQSLKDQGKVRAIGVSNFDPEQMTTFQKVVDIQVCQPPYNMFERQIEDALVPYCKSHDIALMTYGALCRGLLSGKMMPHREFEGADLRQIDPKFQAPRFGQYLKAAARIEQLAKDHYDRPLLPVAIRWVLDMGIEIAIWGGRRPEQMAPLDDIDGWHVSDSFKYAVEELLQETVIDPVGPEFMAPPA
jgi:aryl-alcohol dehydrogenase-like predicted oxidoreductase